MHNRHACVDRAFLFREGHARADTRSTDECPDVALIHFHTVFRPEAGAFHPAVAQADLRLGKEALFCKGELVAGFGIEAPCIVAVGAFHAVEFEVVLEAVEACDQIDMRPAGYEPGAVERNAVVVRIGFSQVIGRLAVGVAAGKTDPPVADRDIRTDLNSRAFVLYALCAIFLF